MGSENTSEVGSILKVVAPAAEVEWGLEVVWDGEVAVGSAEAVPTY